MKTTFYDLSEATRKAWGIDPYDGDIEVDFVIESEDVGSIANNDGDVLEFNLLSKKYKNSIGLDDWDIEITNIDQFPEIKEELE